MKRILLKRGISVLLLLCLALSLAACGDYSQHEDSLQGRYTVEVDGEKYEFLFELGRLYYTDGAKLSTVDRAVYKMVPKNGDEGCKVTLNERGRWVMHYTGSDRITEDVRLVAVWEEKNYLLRFHKDDKTVTHTEITAKNGSKIAYQECEAPAGMRFVGWFNGDYTVQYSNGTAPVAGFETVNAAFFADQASEFIINLRPKFEPIA